MSDCYLDEETNEDTRPILLGIKDNIIIINFYETISWITLNQEDARALAHALLNLADNLQGTIQ